MNGDYLLQLKNISYSYHGLLGETKVLDSLSFGIREGEFVSIVGPSGCGKSTLLSILSGLNRPEEGSILVNNPDGSMHYPKIGYMLQRDHLFEWRSIYQNVCLGLEINHTLTPKRLAYIDALLKEYELEQFKDKRPGELSGGMRQRAALIRTLAMEPQILLMDEPFSALDYQTRLNVSTDICNRIRNAGKTMILITHDIGEAVSLSDRVIVLTKRPAKIKMILPIRLTKEDDKALSARNAPEYNDYFNQIWEAIRNETENPK